MSASYQAFRHELIELCLTTIQHGLGSGKSLAVTTSNHDPFLRRHRATFVTLLNEDSLRGCIGSLTAKRELVIDLARNAHAAAFSDLRFPAVTAGELDGLDIHISILSTPEPINFDSESELVRNLRPGKDGLVLEEGGNRGTFLPSVWESIPDPEEFFFQLKRKTGLAPNHWSEEISVFRYTTEIITRFG
jgi:AmmeMemoRadiSam system protein A